MSFARNSRGRLVLFWSAFAAAALATAAAVWMLQATVQAGLLEQEQRALREESARARAAIHEFAARQRRTLIADLAGFHADGLARTLRRWDEAEPRVIATFESDPAQSDAAPGAASGSTAAAFEPPAELWSAFAHWRASHPDTNLCDLSEVGPWRVAFVPTLDHPDFPARELRYQAENLEVLAYDGRAVDPWAGWAARAGDPHAPWVIWYRPGPDAPVRGCFVDTVALLAELQAAFSDVEVARITLRPVSAAPAIGEGLPDFPALTLDVAPGVLFETRQSRVRVLLGLVAALAGVFVIGAGFLGVYSRREARDAERKTTFVSQVSHELRTPLTSIRMFADMLAAPGLAEDKRMKFAGTISRESQRLAGLIERLLAFNALARGTTVVAVAPCDVAAIVRETLEEQERVLLEVGLRLENAQADADAPVFALTDRGALKQALINLLDNAAKYARDGGLVRVDLRREGDRVIVRVADRGPGIARSQRARIFDPFVQGGSQALTAKAPGLGLGLSIARGLLRSAGGDLALASSEGGATFEIRLPAVSSS